MSNKVSNFPQNQLNGLPTGTCSEVVSDLMTLNRRGKPTSIDELQARIDDYFRFCVENDFRLGVESLALSLGVSRQMFWRWCKADGCSQEWADCCSNARQVVVSFLEQVMMKGRISPPSGIFLLKNIGGYKDVVSFDESASNAPHAPIVALTTSDILRRYGIQDTEDVQSEREQAQDEQLPF